MCEQEDITQPSEPETCAQGESIGAVVYFSSVSENTLRFVKNCDFPSNNVNVYRIPLRPKEPELNVREPYVLIVPTYGGGNIKKAIPIQVRKFLNNRENRSFIRGVISSGNTNFGEAYCAAGGQISGKCGIPNMYSFELTGTQEDIEKVAQGIPRFLRQLKETEETK
ncbi:class Ib ribonucleoside-diphosphate reductase assembly flavoprotein NrdI [Gardnerella vaginalis]|uniref:class Ib ribonucleoside-diphosphate reductase assembly flavoprotein NrdI n=1 Tax=Gardnerella vaginalis TaxID=2702 RepID=UPI0039F0D867